MTKRSVPAEDRSAELGMRRAMVVVAIVAAGICVLVFAGII